MNFGYIAKNGQFWTGIAAYSTPEHAWRPYLETLAAMIGGTVAEGNERNVTIGGRSAPRIDQFLPAHQDGLVEAIGTMLRALNAE